MKDETKPSTVEVLQFIIKNPSASKVDIIESTDFQKTAIETRIDIFNRNQILNQNYPNFKNMGFKSQAFIDIKYDISIGREGGSSQEYVKNQISNLPGVVLIYTVFGDIDLRCKVVGWGLDSIEKLAMDIRKIPGVASSSTDIIVDETVYAKMRETAVKLLEENKKDLEDLLSVTK